MAGDDRANLLRILIATDNHLGVWEKDEIRKDDSFTTFEEIFDHAKRYDVDFVLLGGDLFHDNKPSRTTIVRAMNVLSKYCLKPKPVSFSMLSDESKTLVSGKANFHSDGLHVGLPVFTIHGNHDDPSGADNLSAVDVLSTCKLVNYFGKTPLTGSTVGTLQIEPLLLKKGTTKVALYGLGNVRDERLARAFNTPEGIKWMRAPGGTDEQGSEWFNIFVLHQNRVEHGYGSKNAIKPEYLARFLDLVIWGHEHECIPEAWEPELEEEKARNFSILQPGSSVATALSEGESKRKHIMVLEILGEQWRTIKVALKTVRPFVFESIVLAKQKGLNPDESEGITKLLEAKVKEMISSAQKRAAGQADAQMLPLIRLRVDYTGFSTINAQRFGQQFVGKVANPHDLLLFQKAPARKPKAEAGDPNAAVPMELGMRPEALDEQQIELLIHEQVHQKLQVILEGEMALALQDFVDKDDKQALASCVKKSLETVQRAVVGSTPADKDAVADTEMVALLDQHLEKRRTTHQAEPSQLRRKDVKLPAITGAATRNAGDADAELDEDGPSSSAVLPPASRAKSGAASRAGSNPGAGRGRRQATLGEAFSKGKRPSAAASPDGTQQSAAQRRQPQTPSHGKRAAAQGARKRMNSILESDEQDASVSDVGGDMAADEIEGSDDSSVEDLEAPSRKRKAPQTALKLKRAKHAAPAQKMPAAQMGSVAGSAGAGMLIDSDSDDGRKAQPAATARFGSRRLGTAGSQQPSQATGRQWGARK
ncbi:hypothetical protein CVIRNUC_009451 [Coccomyxa viridis]|uniref:Double-strand break repair protein n=1 Tax=Coccomyxa viridis TaxID=1274662 RepID=A0AAV1IK15_9CHLO|nr:hypothetical protein CVIRNUC_009451 [Coccomyxa viridis]